MTLRAASSGTVGSTPTGWSSPSSNTSEHVASKATPQTSSGEALAAASAPLTQLHTALQMSSLDCS
eukprot:scaffold24509_cov97-Isochrysis_galbana.AAC.1